MDDCVLRRRGLLAGEDLESVCCEYGPGLAMRSLKARREFEVREGVTSKVGDAVLSRLRGLRSGILDSFDLFEWVNGGPVRALGLGVVALKGL